MAHAVSSSRKPSTRYCCGVWRITIIIRADLCGAGELHSRHDVRAVEESALAAFVDDCVALAGEGLELESRPLRLVPHGLQWETMGEAALQVSFALSAGAYATVVMRELLRTRNNPHISAAAAAFVIFTVRLAYL